MTKVGIFVGSIRKDSINRRIAQHIADTLPESWEPHFIEYADVPTYNADWDTDDAELPASAERLRRETAEMDAFIFVTPEYNRSVPGGLKNALDVVSRPAGSFIMANSPTMIVATSFGPYGGFGASQILRQTLIFMDIPVMAQPELYLNLIGQSFNEDGSMTERTAKFLGNAVTEFEKFSKRWL